MRISSALSLTLTIPLLGGGCDEHAPFSSFETDGDELDEIDLLSPSSADPGVDPAAARKHGFGMTWAKIGHDPQLGVDHVGCANCNAYAGDTSCAIALPVLCIKPTGAAKPGGLYTDFYNGWTGGFIALTPAVQGTTLTSAEAADALCAANFGCGWRMAEFHDGAGGWNWYAFGEVESSARFWVHIDDQLSNCWDP